MLVRVISLVLIVLLIAGLIWAVRWFVSWLGRGKDLKNAVDAHVIDQELLRRYKREHRHLTKAERKIVLDVEHAAREAYLDKMRIGWYQIVYIFIGGSVLGLLLEELWMFLTVHVVQSRVGLIWGPFSPLYGVGAVLLTIITFVMRRHHAKSWQVFLISMIVGGLLEQITGWGMETFMHVVSWDYIAGHVPGAITKWVALPFLFFWGVLGLAWARLVMPELLYRIGMPTTRRQVAFVAVIAAYLTADIFMTVACLERRVQRDDGIPPQNWFQSWIDQHYDDEEMADIFQNMDVTTGQRKSPAATS